MAGKTRPLTIRLPIREIGRLRERAARVRGRPTAIARELILAGLINGGSREQAERMLMIERRLAAIDQQIQAISRNSEMQSTSLNKLLAMFDGLLQVLTGEGVSEEAGDA